MHGYRIVTIQMVGRIVTAVTILKKTPACGIE